jgi:FtsH-binding integral membrane protein
MAPGQQYPAGVSSDGVQVAIPVYASQPPNAQPQYSQQQYLSPGYGYPAPQHMTVVPRADMSSMGVAAAGVPGEVPGLAAMDEAVRKGFIQKVMSILFVQLMVTFGIVLAFTFSKDVSNFVRANIGIYYAALALVFVCIIVLSCCTEFAKMHPWGLIFLGILTVAEGITLGVFASFNQAGEVMLAVGATALVCFVLTLFACTTKIDFTGYGVYLLVALVVFIFFSIIASFFSFQGRNLLIGGLGTLLFSFYLIYDIQLVVGGKHRKHQFGVDDYVFAARKFDCLGAYAARSVQDMTTDPSLLSLRQPGQSERLPRHHQHLHLLAPHVQRQLT